MRCEGDLLAGVPDASAERKTNCTLVSTLYLLSFSAISLVEVTVRGKQLTTKTSKPSSALRRRKSSRSSSRVGFIPSIVSYSLFSTGVCAKQFTVPAESDWPLFSSSGLTSPTSTITGGETADLSKAIPLAPEYLATPEPPASSLVPEPPTSSLTPEPPASSLVPATSSLPLTPGIPPPLVSKPPGSSLALGTPSSSNRADGARQPGTTQSTAAPDTLDSVQDRVTPTSVMDFANSYLSNELQLSTLTDPHLKENAPPPDCRPSPNLNPLADITDEPAWMKKKRTLTYFRETVKFGCLPMSSGTGMNLRDCSASRKL